MNKWQKLCRVTEEIFFWFVWSLLVVFFITVLTVSIVQMAHGEKPITSDVWCYHSAGAYGCEQVTLSLSEYSERISPLDVTSRSRNDLFVQTFVDKRIGQNIRVVQATLIELSKPNRNASSFFYMFDRLTNVKDLLERESLVCARFEEMSNERAIVLKIYETITVYI